MATPKLLIHLGLSHPNGNMVSDPGAPNMDEGGGEAATPLMDDSLGGGEEPLPEEEPQFMPPNGVTPPDNAKPGDEFTMEGTFRLEKDGKFSLCKIEGVPLNGDKAEASEDEGDDKLSFAQAVSKRMRS